MTSSDGRYKNIKNSEAGFVAAEFLFSFVLVISCGVIVFALTYSLMTVEVAQYVTWSAARAYSSGHISKSESEAAGKYKFNKLIAEFPLLTGATGEWFELKLASYGQNSGQKAGMRIPEPTNLMNGETRHPWSGFSSTLELKLFKSLKVPFLGPITNDESLFNFTLHAFILRNPSQTECREFFKKRCDEIKKLDGFKYLQIDCTKYVPHEDNGC